MNTKLSTSLTCLVAVSLLLTSCSGSSSTPIPAQSNDLLEKILARGTLVIATDPAYPPQREVIEGATRDTTSKCAPTEYTERELTGFDVETAAEIARQLYLCIKRIRLL